MATVLKVRKDGKLVREEKKEDFPLWQFLLMMIGGIILLSIPMWGVLFG